MERAGGHKVLVTLVDEPDHDVEGNDDKVHVHLHKETDLLEQTYMGVKFRVV